MGEVIPISRAMARMLADSRTSPRERRWNQAEKLLKEAADAECTAGNPDGPASERWLRVLTLGSALYHFAGVECLPRPYVNPGFPAPTFCTYCQSAIEVGELFCSECTQFLLGLLGNEGMVAAERCYEKALFEDWSPPGDTYRPWRTCYYREPTAEAM